MKLKALSVLLGAIALVAMPLTRQVQAQVQVEETQAEEMPAEELACPAAFEGIELSEDQQMQLQALEGQLDDRVEAIMPVSPEAEATVDQLENSFEQQVSSMLSPQQEEQVAKLDAWVENQVSLIAPELFDAETDPELSAEQEEALGTVEAAYDETFQSILTPDQQQQIGVLEDQLDADVEAVMPMPSADQAASLEAAESEYEQGLMQVLTAEQRQQLETNLACTNY